MGNVTFHSDTSLIAEHLYYTIMRPIRGHIEILLEHYRVLFYSGQLTLSFPFNSYRNFVNVRFALFSNLNVFYSGSDEILIFFQHIGWSGAEEFQNATRNIWYVGEDLAGYAQSAANLTEVLVRNAGHTVLADQPKWGFDLYQKFLSNKPIVDEV